MKNKIKKWVKDHETGIVVTAMTAGVAAVASAWCVFGYKLGWAVRDTDYRRLMIRNPEIKVLCNKAYEEVKDIYS